MYQNFMAAGMCGTKFARPGWCPEEPIDEDMKKEHHNDNR